jgi:hypothetical protein
VTNNKVKSIHKVKEKDNTMDNTVVEGPATKEEINMLFEEFLKSLEEDDE